MSAKLSMAGEGQADESHEQELDQLVAVARRYGSDPDYCLAGGGNASIKSGNRLWVTASGACLGQLTRRELVEVDRVVLGQLLDRVLPEDQHQREAEVLQGMNAAVGPVVAGLRPSTETLLHHLLPHRLVVHTHPSRVNAVTCCTSGRHLVQQHFGPEVLWQPYVDPGICLARALRDQIRLVPSNPTESIVILLENHGLIVAANEIDAIHQATAALVEQLYAWQADMPRQVFRGNAYPQRIDQMANCVHALSTIRSGQVASPDQSSEVMDLVGSSEGRDTAMLGPLIPDQIVYCRAVPLWLDLSDNGPVTDETLMQWRDAFEAYEQRHGCEPWVVLIAGVGLVALRESQAMADITRTVFRDAARVMRLAKHLGGVQAMSQPSVRFIEQWEAESYRRRVIAQCRT